MIKCQVCGYENPDDAAVCLNCGSPLERAKISEAIDDISGEATVMLGMPMKNLPAKPPAAPSEPAKSPAPKAPAAAAPAPRPSAPPAPPAPVAKAPEPPKPAAPPPAPQPPPSGGLNPTTLIAITAGVTTLVVALIAVVVFLLVTR
jgi:hypothetical protein